MIDTLTDPIARAALRDWLHVFSGEQGEEPSTPMQIELYRIVGKTIERERSTCATLCDEYARTATEDGQPQSAHVAETLAAQIRGRNGEKETKT